MEDIQDLGARFYSGAIGRMFSVDPAFRSYVHLSTYQFSANNPILFIDYNGYGPIFSKEDARGKGYFTGLGMGLVSGVEETAEFVLYSVMYASAELPNGGNPAMAMNTHFTYMQFSDGYREYYFSMSGLLPMLREIATDEKLRTKVGNNIKKSLGIY